MSRTANIFLSYLTKHAQRPRLRWGERPWNFATTSVEEAKVNGGCVIRRIEITVAPWDTKETLLVYAPDGTVVYRAVKAPYKGWVTIRTSPLARALAEALAQAEAPTVPVAPVPEVAYA